MISTADSTRILFLVVLLFSVRSQSSNRLWILIDNVHIFECQGVTNLISVDPHNIQVIDSNDDPVTLIEAPGEYRISFRNIKVHETFTNLNGFMRITLQVPFAAGPLGVNWHYTYQAIPHKKLFDGSQCDNESGVVTDPFDDSIEYCKYCDLCQASRTAESVLGTADVLGHKYLAGINNGPETSFGKICKQINSTTYDLYRTVSLPDKYELENEANTNFKGIDEQLKERLKVGRGKLHVFLILQSNSEPPENLNVWYRRTEGCECCARDNNGRSHCQRNIINRLLSQASKGALGGSGNHCPSCNNIYAQDCLRGTSKKIGCVTVEFNFRVTDNPTEADKFKQQSLKQVRAPLTLETSNGRQQNVEESERKFSNSADILKQSPRPVVPSSPLDETTKEVCINSIISPMFSKYCRDNWDAKFCCDLPSCKGKC